MIVRHLLVSAMLLAAGLASPHAAEANRLDGISGPQALAATSLAGQWRFVPEGAPATTIEVPGGGWYKQGFTDVSAASYRRTITVPDVEPGQTVELSLGAVNHEATLYVDGNRVGTKTTSFMPQAWDLTPFVTAGGEHELRIDVKGRDALTDGNPNLELPRLGFGLAKHLVPTAADWCEAIAQGIFGWAELRVYPGIRITDTFVRPSVERDELAYDVTVANGTSETRTTVVEGRITGGDFEYPGLPSRELALEPGETRTVTFSVPWKLGRDSYWWPNIPYRKGYRAQLHDLRLRLSTGHRARYRFGFKEFRQVGTHYELNGVRANLRGDSLQAAMWDRIDRGDGAGDAIHTFPGFLPGRRGWPKAVDNYQRLNMSVLRIHQVPGSPYMLDVADRMGLMIIDETAIRGSESRQDFVNGRQNFIDHVRDLVVRDRNHASIVKWSQSNEPDANQQDTSEFQQALYATVMANDPTRPVSVDVTSDTYEDIKHPNFSVFQHYIEENGTITQGYTEDVHPRDDRPFGRGEFIWPVDPTPQGFMWFATATERMREKDASDIRPYTLGGAWAGVIPGTGSKEFLTDSHALFPLYGEDNLERPWRHPTIRRIQKGFHPVLVADRAYWDANKRSDPAGRWPSVPQIHTGGPRELVIFNDTFGGERVDVEWELSTGAKGAFSADVPRGGRVFRTVDVPSATGSAVLTLRASKGGRLVFTDDLRFGA